MAQDKLISQARSKWQRRAHGRPQLSGAELLIREPMTMTDNHLKHLTIGYDVMDRGTT